MLVKERMTHPVITVSPDMPIPEAIDLMKREHVRRTPVFAKGKLVGIVSRYDLLTASPSTATSLSIWEVNTLLNKITVKEVMSKKVVTVQEETPIEEVARMMSDNEVSAIPVMRGETMVGIITETDLFKVFLEMMGARDKGVRFSVIIPDGPGQIAKLGQAIHELNGNIIALGTSAGEDASNYSLTAKVQGVELDTLRSVIEPLVIRLTDIRTT